MVCRLFPCMHMNGDLRTSVIKSTKWRLNLCNIFWSPFCYVCLYASSINNYCLQVMIYYRLCNARCTPTDLTPTRRSSRRYGQSALNLRRLLANAHLPTRLSSFVAILVVNLINTCARELTSNFAEHVCPTLPARCGV